MTELQNNQKNRIVYYDYLRVFATFAVIMLHTAAQGWEDADVHTFEWLTHNVYDCIASWGVPAFLMISGALFLSREKIDIKRLFSKNISRLAAAYFFWCFVYAVPWPLTKDFGALIKKLPIDILEGPYHLWFVPMIIGLYICLPLIHRITRSKELTKYFLILSLIFAVALPQIKSMITDFSSGYITALMKPVGNIVLNMRMDMVLGFTGYFILGYVLSKNDISEKQRKIIYALGILGVISAVFLNVAVSFRKNEPLNTYCDNLTLNSVFVSAAIFVWFKYNVKGTEKLDGIIAKMSEYSFGVYLVHILIMKILEKIGFDSMAFNPVLAVPAVFICVAVISFAASAVLNKIPVLKRWIV